MKNVLRFTRQGVIALAAIALAGLSFTETQAAPRWKSVQLEFTRFGGPATSFPNASGNVISGTLANGGKGGSGVAVSPQDTSQAIFIGNHYAFSGPVLRANAELLADTTVVWGSLILHSTVGTIDTIKVARDISVDGVAWTAVDSLAAGGFTTVSGTLRIQPIAGDSLGIDLDAVTVDQAGNTVGAGAVVLYGNVNELHNRRTRLALAGINYVRFRIWMTPGDNVAAGANGGVSGVFSYPESVN